ncbi:MAG: YceI family protein [Rhodanobacteraceae bacterium]
MNATAHALLPAMILLIAPFTATARPALYRFDPVHTQVWFSAAHEKFSHPWGRVRIADGWFTFDPDDWSTAKVDVVIDLTSLDMGDKDWNDALKASGFLDVEHWPSAHYVSGSVEQTGAKTGVIHGDLKLLGKTIAVDVAFTLNDIGYDAYAFSRKAGFSATATLHRSSFGLTRFPKVVGEDIRVHAEVEGERKGSVRHSRPANR